MFALNILCLVYVAIHMQRLPLVTPHLFPQKYRHPLHILQSEDPPIIHYHLSCYCTLSVTPVHPDHTGTYLPLSVLPPSQITIMPPLERHSFTPISDASATSDDNSHTLDNSNTRRAATDACGSQPPHSASASLSPRRISISPNNLHTLVLADRDVIIDSKTFYEQSSSESASKSADSNTDFCGTQHKEPLDLIDMFLSNMCVGPCAPSACAPAQQQPTSKSRQQKQQQLKERGQQLQQPQRPIPVQLKKRRKQIVYPIAKYGSNTNLDNKCLVDQRRRSLEQAQHLFFRPVQCSESEHTDDTDEHESLAKKAKLDP
jgi:hypothetical protein